MEKGDKGSTMIRMGVSGWMFLPVPAYPGCPGSKAVKRSLLLIVCECTVQKVELWSDMNVLVRHVMWLSVPLCIIIRPHRHHETACCQRVCSVPCLLVCLILRSVWLLKPVKAPFVVKIIAAKLCVWWRELTTTEKSNLGHVLTQGKVWGLQRLCGL